MASKPRAKLVVALLLLAAIITIEIGHRLVSGASTAIGSFKLVQIPSAGMEPTLKSGSMQIVDFTAYKSSAPKVNDIVVFRPPDFLQNGESAKYMLIQRCVGVAGDIVELRSGMFYRNGEQIKEPFVEKNATHGFKLVKYKDEVIPIIIEGRVINRGLRTHPKFWLEDSQEVYALANQAPVAIPEGTILVMGDNRKVAYDSRSWGPLSLKSVLGKLKLP